MVQMKRYQSTEIIPFSISPPRRKQLASKLTSTELRDVRSMPGKIGYLGVATSPFAAFAASYIQQCIPTLTIAGLKSINGVVREVKRRTALITYLKPTTDEIQNTRIVSFSDAGDCHPEDKKRAQEGCIYGLSFGEKIGSIFHTIGFVSRTQRQRTQSSAAAETLAAVLSFGHASLLQDSYAELTGKTIPITLVVDSRGLHASFSTEHHPRDPSMLADVAFLRDTYFSGHVDVIAWVPGTSNPADPLTKPLAGKTAELLHSMLVHGRLLVNIDNLRHYGPALNEEM